MPTDAFDMLGLEPRFDLNAADLQRAFLALSASAHPDRAGGDEVRAAALNAARQALADPEQRANALLARLGGPAKEADRSLPEGFLAAMMDARERLEDARARGDAGAVDGWLAWAEERRSGHVRAVGALFAACPVDTAAVRRELNAWRYIERMIEQIEGADPLGAGGPPR